MSSNFHLRIANFCLELLKRLLVIGENMKKGNVWQTHSHRTALSDFGPAPFLPLMGQKRNGRSDAISLPCGRAELFCLCQGVPGWQGASCACPVLPTTHLAGGVAGGLGRAAAEAQSTCKCVCDESETPAARETWGAPRQSWLRGLPVASENFLSATERQWLLSQAVGSDCSPVFWSPAQVGFIFLVLTLQGASPGCDSVFWAWWTTTVLSQHQLSFFSAKTCTRLSFTHPIPQLFTQHLVFGKDYFLTMPQR